MTFSFQSIICNTITWAGLDLGINKK